MKTKKYYRIFTERLPKVKKIKKSLFLLLGIYLILISSFSFWYASALYSTNKSMKQQKLKEQRNLLYWEQVIAKHPNYPDAFYNAAYYAARLSQKEKAIEYVQKALYFDPNFRLAEDLKGEISRL